MNLKEQLAVSVPFWIAVGACYLFGYWGTVGINVLEFIGFIDIAKVALYPLVVGLASFTLGALLPGITASSKFPPGGGQATTIGRFGRKYGRQLLGLVVLAIAAAHAYVPEPFKWFVIFFLMLPFAAAAGNLDFFISLFPSVTARAIAIPIFVMLPTLSFALGRYDIYLAKGLVSARTVDIERSKLPLISETGHPVVYLGLLGATFVFLETKSGKIVLLKQDQTSPLFINPTQRI